MFGSVINTLGLCIIGGKYILMLILAAMTVFSGSINPDALSFAITEISQ